MKPISAKVLLAGLSRALLDEFRQQIEAAIRTLPLTNFSMRWSEEQDLVVADVEYDGDDRELNENLLTRIMELVEGAIPEDRFEKTPHVEDPQLGSLWWDQRLWAGECDCEGLEEPLPVHLCTENEVTPPSQALLNRAGEIVRNFAAYDQRWKAFAVEDLCELCNSTWNAGEPITREQFRDTLQITGITLYEEGWINSGWTLAYYFAGDMFGEHDVEISIGPTGELRAGLVGG